MTAPAYVQSVKATGHNTTGGVTGNITTTVGNLLVAHLLTSNNSAAEAFTSFVDSKSNTWTLANGASQRLGTANQWQRVYYTVVATAKGGASHNFTVAQAPGANSDWNIVVTEYSGAALTSVLAAVAAQSIAAGVAIAATLNAGITDPLIVACVYDSGSANPSTLSFDNSITFRDGYTDGTSQTPGGTGSRSVSGTFSATVTASVTGSTPQAAFTLLAFKPTSIVFPNQTGRLQGGMTLPNGGLGG